MTGLFSVLLTRMPIITRQVNLIPSEGVSPIGEIHKAHVLISPFLNHTIMVASKQFYCLCAGQVFLSYGLLSIHDWSLPLVYARYPQILSLFCFISFKGYNCVFFIMKIAGLNEELKN